MSSAERCRDAGLAFAPDLAAIRALAGVLPGPLPVAVNGIRVAASIRPRKFVIQGGDDTPVTMPRTAFQLVYPDCTVMIDAGMDKATHDSFSPDKPEPYYPDAFARLERALDAGAADHPDALSRRPRRRRCHGAELLRARAPRRSRHR